VAGRYRFEVLAGVNHWIPEVALSSSDGFSSPTSVLAEAQRGPDTGG